MHRKARGGFTLCGIKVSFNKITLKDNMVTCKDCLSLLNDLNHVETKTTWINKNLIKS